MSTHQDEDAAMVLEDDRSDIPDDVQELMNQQESQMSQSDLGIFAASQESCQSDDETTRESDYITQLVERYQDAPSTTIKKVRSDQGKSVKRAREDMDSLIEGVKDKVKQDKQAAHLIRPLLTIANNFFSPDPAEMVSDEQVGQMRQALKIADELRLLLDVFQTKRTPAFAKYKKLGELYEQAKSREDRDKLSREEDEVEAAARGVGRAPKKSKKAL